MQGVQSYILELVILKTTLDSVCIHLRELYGVFANTKQMQIHYLHLCL